MVDWVGTITPDHWSSTSAPRTTGSSRRASAAPTKDFDLTKLGLPASLVSQLPSPAYFGRWELRTATASLGRDQSINITNNYNLVGNVTKIAGSHTMKIGIDLRRIHYIQQNSGNILLVHADRRSGRSGSGTRAKPISGDALRIVPAWRRRAARSNYPLYPFYRQWYFAPYFQDDWKVSRKLTLNLGLRWDYNGAPDEKYNRINRGFDPTVASPIASQIPADDARACIRNCANLKGGFEFAGVNGNPRDGRQQRHEQLAAAHRRGLPVQRQAGAARRLRALLHEPEQQLPADRRVLRRTRRW